MDPSQGSITLPLVNDEMLVNGAENNGFKKGLGLKNLSVKSVKDQ